MAFLEFVCSVPKRFSLNEKSSTIVRRCFSLLRTRVGQDPQDLWCDNFYLPYLISAARMLGYLWGERTPFMVSILFTEPKWNWSVVQPLLGISLPRWYYSKTNKSGGGSKGGVRKGQKELAQAARRQYLKDLGGYDLSAFPSPTPSGNKIGNCAETWGHCVSKGASHQALELGGIALNVGHAREMQNLSAIRSIHWRGPYIIGGWSGGGIYGYEVSRQLLSAGRGGLKESHHDR